MALLQDLIGAWTLRCCLWRIDVSAGIAYIRKMPYNIIILRRSPMEEAVMEHNPMLDYENGLCVTYSDLKKTEDGQPFITIYFEKPTKKTRSGFKSAQINYPDGKFKKIVGYKDRGIKKLQALVDTYGEIAYDMAMEDSQNA